MTDLDNQGPVRVPRFGLSGKLLVLTILFVMIVQVMIYVPAVSIFRLNWLNDRLAAARTAALVLYAAPSGMVPDDLARDILSSIGAQAVVMKTGQTAASAGDDGNARGDPSQLRPARSQLA